MNGCSSAAILPALSTGLQLHQRLHLAEGRSEALTMALDSLEDGVILTDETGRPKFLNARATRMVAEADGLDIAASPLPLSPSTPSHCAKAPRGGNLSAALQASDRALEDWSVGTASRSS